MHMRKDAMLPFVEKAGNEKTENKPLWQGRIVYPTTLMITIPPYHPLKREAYELSGTHFPWIAYLSSRGTGIKCICKGHETIVHRGGYLGITSSLKLDINYW